MKLIKEFRENSDLGILLSNKKDQTIKTYSLYRPQSYNAQFVHLRPICKVHILSRDGNHIHNCEGLGMMSVTIKD